MRPCPLHSRNDLLDLLLPHAPTKACKTAMQEDRAAVLGSFTGPEGLPMFAVRVESQHGQVWLMGLTMNPQAYKYQTVYLVELEWREWHGDQNGLPSLHNGDDPKEYGRRRFHGNKETTARFDEAE